ncbi:MAG: preprotein translocase subunit SecG [Planctomycetes bacterium]|nr:preprotein translocase subunit SecG [Planctomycetota bacterium]
MVKAERAFKWGVAIVVIFGIINAFFFLNMVIGLKIVLPVLCVFLIGSILLQSGKGGGLASIGGLGDQSAFGTKTSSFLTQVTYLLGAAFIVATIFLFKLSIPVSAINPLIGHGSHESQHVHGDECDHDHDAVPHAEGKTDKSDKFGMQGMGDGKPTAPAQESLQQPPAVKGEAPQNP